MKIIKSTVKRIEKPTNDLCIITLELEKPLHFEAGQFIGIGRKLHTGRIIKKSYSIASSPSNSNEIELAIKRVENGYMSNFLYNLEEGTELAIEGPYGIFTLDYPPQKDLVFIATGTGIAPMRSMIKYLFEKGTDIQVTLVYGVRNEEDLLYRKEFESLEKNHNNFEFIPVLSNPNNNWKGETGYVQKASLDLLDPEKHKVYVCGLIDMVQDVKNNLKVMGFNREDVKMERYV